MKNSKIELSSAQKRAVENLLEEHIKGLKNRADCREDFERIKFFSGIRKAYRVEEMKRAETKLDKILTAIEEVATTVPRSGSGMARFYSYSGRCMYGVQCVGATINRYDYEEVCKEFKRRRIEFSSDNMGTDMVVYFPYIEFADAEHLIPQDEEEAV